MKGTGKAVVIAALSLGFVLGVKAEAEAAQITGVTQIRGDESAIGVSWDADLGSSWYKIEMSADGQNWVEKETGTTPQETIYGLTAGSSYFLRVSGYNDYTLENQTAEVSAPIEVVTAPDMRNAVIAQTGATTSSITVGIKDVSGANYYAVGMDNGISVSILGSLTNAGAVTGEYNEIKTTELWLDAGTSYTLKVFAGRISAEGFQALSDKQEYFKTLAKKIGRSEFGLTNAYMYINTFDFAAGNNSSRSVDGYQWEFQNNSGKSMRTVDGYYSISVSNFIEGTFYKYRVRTYIKCAGGNIYSGWSDFRYIGVPKNMKGVAQNKKIKVSWGKVNGAAKYAVYLSTSSEGGYKKVATVKGTSTTIKKFNKKALKKNKMYYVRIIAQNASGIASECAWTGEVRMP